MKIRVIRPSTKDPTLVGLEARCRQDRRRDLDPADPKHAIEQSLALKVSELDAFRAVQAKQAKSLMDVECYTNTELMQMEARTPRYSPYRYPEREKLQRRLVKVEEERRRLSLVHHERLARIHEELLDLLQQRDQARA